MEESHIPGCIWAPLRVDPVTLITVITTHPKSNKRMEQDVCVDCSFLISLQSVCLFLPVAVSTSGS